MLVLQITGTVDLEVSVILPRLACSTWFPRSECRVFWSIKTRWRHTLPTLWRASAALVSVLFWI